MDRATPTLKSGIGIMAGASKVSVRVECVFEEKGGGPFTWCLMDRERVQLQ